MSVSVTVVGMDMWEGLVKTMPEFFGGVSVSQEPPGLVGLGPGYPGHAPNMACSGPDNGPSAGVSHATVQRKCLSRKGLGVLGMVNILGLIGRTVVQVFVRALANGTANTAGLSVK